MSDVFDVISYSVDQIEKSWEVMCWVSSFTPWTRSRRCEKWCICFYLLLSGLDWEDTRNDVFGASFSCHLPDLRFPSPLFWRPTLSLSCKFVHLWPFSTQQSLNHIKANPRDFHASVFWGICNTWANMDHHSCNTLVNGVAYLVQSFVWPSVANDSSQMFAVAGIKLIHSCPAATIVHHQRQICCII